MKTLLTILGHVFLVAVLTVVSQVGGLVWLVVEVVSRAGKKRLTVSQKFVSFVVLYLIISFLIVPFIAPWFGRERLPISKKGTLRPQSYLTIVANRGYVKPSVFSELHLIANEHADKYLGRQVSYLDANFPFWDGFPLLPHLSHNDGRKVDLSFQYDLDGQATNRKPSTTGYGRFVGPKSGEKDQTRRCLNAGYWQYDFSKYLSLGSRDDLTFDQEATKDLVQRLVKRKLTQMILIEPHLESRMQLKSDKVRFQGCHAVRHDDHIHYQVKK